MFSIVKGGSNLRAYGSAGVILVILLSLIILYLTPNDRSNANGRSPKRPSFSVDFDDPVAMRIAASAHYAIDTEEGAEEWAKLLPPTGHLVNVAENDESPPKPYTVTLFHQLKCLDIIREQYLAPPTQVPARMTRHCMNYLRQTVWCRPNLWLESTKNTVGTASRAYDAVCRDWTQVYNAAARNHEEFMSGGREPRNASRNALH